MKLCMLPPSTDRVWIPCPPELKPWNVLDFLLATSGPVEIQVDTLKLEPRDLNGITCMVAYDRITDTLYIQKPDHEEP